MTDTLQPTFQIRFIRSIAEISAERWNALTGTQYPFLRHEFLLAMETSGCTTVRSGWQVFHALIELPATTPDSATALVACMPLYIKTDSMGEYVFDWAWADAYARHSMRYYPKLISAIPFTPCSGPRLNIAAGYDADTVWQQLLKAITTITGKGQLSSFHLLFPDQHGKETLKTEQLLLRTGCQYQWFNQQYESFDDFLATFSSRKRKNLRKERSRVVEQGISFRALEGAEVQTEQWEKFYEFYANTYFIRGRNPYLTPDFFNTIAQTMPEYLMLVLAELNGEAIAGALFFKGSDTLYGRYWGCSNEYQFLHFETCYYQGIDYCIKHAIARIDSGAQGEHKIQRGFKPVPTWSLHWIEHEQFRDAIAGFLEDEEKHIQQYLSHASEFLPFRKDLTLNSAKLSE